MNAACYSYDTLRSHIYESTSGLLVGSQDIEPEIEEAR